MKQLALLPIVGFALLSACSDTATSPTSAPKPSLLTAFNTQTAPNGASYRNGYGEPVCSVINGAISCTGTAISGVGHTDADLVLSVNYSGSVRCRNNGGKIVDVKTQSTTAAGGDNLTDLKNGTLYVSAINSGAAPTAAEFEAGATCPNGNWDKVFLGGSSTITSYTYTLTFDGFFQPCISKSFTL